MPPHVHDAPPAVLAPQTEPQAGQGASLMDGRSPPPEELHLLLRRELEQGLSQGAAWRILVGSGQGSDLQFRRQGA